jgi:large repetitive protein
MIRLLLSFTFCLTLVTNLVNAQAQEICNNGIDDDGDGFVDCYDRKCSFNINCQGSFLTDVACGIKPEPSPGIAVKLKYSSGPDGLANHVNNIVAGDIDGDGRTDLVTTYTNFTGSVATINKINAFSAPSSSLETLSLSKSIDVQVVGGSSFGVGYEAIAMGDIYRDGCAEVFVVTKNLSNESNFRIAAFDCNGTQRWTSAALPFPPGLIGLADFDHDGLVELYTRTQIYDAQTGALMGQYAIDGSNWGKNSNAPVAVDILSNSPNLELVSGCRIYSVNINRAAMVATIMLIKQLPQYYTRTARLASNPASVADFNQDGYLDILATGSENQYNDNTTIFFWDVQNNTVKKYTDFSTFPKGAVNGSGRISLADVDGDGALNAVYVSGLFMYALKEGATGLERLWRVPIEEGSSGITGPATFDLDGDGKAEVVYRDENVFSIFTTSPTGLVTQSPPIQCLSRTQTENPVIVDLDNDGAAEICMVCSTSTTAQAGKNIPMYDPGEVRVYESANKPWLPARKVWNQHGYFVTNVNDDLTIPRVQQLHHLVYANDAPCKQGMNRPFNAFMTQATYLDFYGCPTVPAPDLAFTPFHDTKLIHYVPYNCLADSLEVTFRYVNKGQARVSNERIGISFYRGDPTQDPVGAIHLRTKTVSLSGMNPGDTITTTTRVKNLGGTVDLYIVLNDQGTILPLNLPAQTRDLSECNYSNNIVHATIAPSPVPIVAEVIKNTLACVNGPGLPASVSQGELRAYIPVDGRQEFIDYDFYWFNGAMVKPAPDYMGPQYTHLASGIYTVYARHKTWNCVSDTVSALVNQNFSHLDARLVLEHELDDYVNPNGALRAVVNDADGDGTGDSEDNFTYAWYAGTDILVGDVIGTGHILSSLDAGTYAVLVSDKATGCQDSASASVRRRQIDEVILGTEGGPGVAGVSLYPNPGTENFTIRIDNGYVGEVHLQVQSVMGNEVHKTFSGHKGAKTWEVPVETQKLKPGFYLIKVSAGNGTTHRKWTKF